VGSRGGKTQAVDDTLDQMALVAIVQVIPEYVMMVVVEQERTWDALKEMHIGEERVKKAKVQTLKRDFNDMYMGESEKKEFSLKVTTIDTFFWYESGGDRRCREALAFCLPTSSYPCIVSTIKQ
jgi:hypothetical protein